MVEKAPAWVCPPPASYHDSYLCKALYFACPIIVHYLILLHRLSDLLLVKCTCRI